MPRNLVRIGAVLAVFGLLGGGASIFVPWARRPGHLKSVAVLNLDRGLWYVTLLLALFALLGAAAMGSDQGRKLAGVAGPIVSLVTAFVVVGLITSVGGRPAAGGWLGLASLPLLGFACGLIAIGRARRADRG